MSEFKREGRYIVVKPDCEDSLRTERLRNYIDEMCFHTPDCVVIEADWPEYEPVWRMIELRVTGASADATPVEVLGYSVVGNPYAIRLTKGEVLELSENYADHLIELVDRKHLTDAQVELAALREELAMSQRKNERAELVISGSMKALTRVDNMWKKRWLEKTGEPAIALVVDDEFKAMFEEIKSYRQRLAAAEQRSTTLEATLKFYADGDHLLLADPDEWDTCSGEPINWLHDAAGTASVEDGSVAKQALNKPTESGASE